LALPYLRDDAGFGEFIEIPPNLSAIRSRVYIIRLINFLSYCKLILVILI